MHSSPTSLHFPSLADKSIFDIPEFLLLIARHLSSRDLSNAVRVSRPWNRIITPLLYRSIKIKSARARLSFLSPEAIDAFERYGDQTNHLYSLYGSVLDLFREPEFCPFQYLRKLELADYAEDDGFFDDLPEFQYHLLGLALIAREKTRRTALDRIARSNPINNNNHIEIRTRGFELELILDPEEPPYTYQMVFDPLHVESLKRSVQLLIHPPEFDSFLDLLRNNRSLRSLSVFTFRPGPSKPSEPSVAKVYPCWKN